MGALHSPKLQHCWNLTIRLFSVISMILIGGMILPLCREAVGVFYSPSRLGNTYLETKSSESLQAKLPRKFNNYPPKSQIHRWVSKSQVTGSVNNLNKKAENPRSCKKLIARCFDHVDAVRDSVGRSPKISLWRRSQEHGLSRAPLQRILQRILSFTHPESRSSINSNQLTWSFLFHL